MCLFVLCCFSGHEVKTLACKILKGSIQLLRSIFLGQNFAFWDFKGKLGISGCGFFF